MKIPDNAFICSFHDDRGNYLGDVSAATLRELLESLWRDAERYRARRAEVYQLRLRTEIPGYRNWKPTTVEEFNAEYDAACDKEIAKQDAARTGGNKT